MNATATGVRDQYHQFVTGEGPFSHSTILRLADGLEEATDKLASRIVAGLPDNLVRAFAVAYVAEIIDSHRRREAREREVEATRIVRQQEAEIRERECQLRCEETQRENKKRLISVWEQWRDNPDFGGPSEYHAEAFCEWLGPDLYPSWYEAARAKSNGSNKDWDEHGYITIWRRFQKNMLDAENQYAAQMILNPTEEFLATVIAMGDGTKTTWGEATIGQHEERIKMLMGNAVANAESAARHRAAIRMIEEAGAVCLRDLTPLDGIRVSDGKETTL